jgi:hypothetical protein
MVTLDFVFMFSLFTYKTNKHKFISLVCLETNLFPTLCRKLSLVSFYICDLKFISFACIQFKHGIGLQAD